MEQAKKSGIENLTQVEAVAISKEGNEVVLLISDHLDWVSEVQHLSLLQDKLNLYMDYILYGQLETEIPQAKLPKKVIEIKFVHEPTENAINFLKKCSSLLDQYQIAIRYHH